MNKRAFTLIEMIATLIVAIILVAISSVAIGKTMKTNKEKALQMKVANVIRATEDFILERNVKLVPNFPLYFSVNAMEKAGIMEGDVTEALSDVRGEEGPFYVKVRKDTNDKVKYIILNSTEFSASVTLDAGDFQIIGNNSSTITTIEKEPIPVVFKLQKTITSPLYNLDISRLQYTIEQKNPDNSYTRLIDNGVVKNLKVLQDGSYKFKINNGLAPGEYKLTLKLTSDSLDTTITAEDPISLVISKVNEDKLICSSLTLPVTWSTSDVTLNVTCKQDKTNLPATIIKYKGYKYADATETDGTGLPETLATSINQNGETTFTLGMQGYYKLEISGVLGTAKSNTIYQTVRIDKTAPAVPLWAALNANNVTYNTDTGPWTNLAITWSDFSKTDTGGSGFAKNEYSTGCTKNNWLEVLGEPYIYNNNDVQYCLRSVDKAGNESVSTKSAYFRVDTTKPVIGTTPTSSCSGCTRLTVNATDNLTPDGSLRYSFDGGSWINTKYKDYTSSTTATVRVQDLAGNISDLKNVSVVYTPPPPPPPPPQVGLVPISDYSVLWGGAINNFGMTVYIFGNHTNMKITVNYCRYIESLGGCQDTVTEMIWGANSKTSYPFDYPKGAATINRVWYRIDSVGGVQNTNTNFYYFIR